MGNNQQKHTAITLLGPRGSKGELSANVSSIPKLKRSMKGRCLQTSWMKNMDDGSQLSVLEICLTHFNPAIDGINHPSGGKPRQRFERFEKSVVFARAKLLIHSAK